MSGVGVLTVHHDEDARRAARAVVNATSGFEEVAAAGSAEEALDLAVRLRPGLALVAAEMPGIDGLETSRRLGEAVPETIVCILHEALTRSALQELWEQHRTR